MTQKVEATEELLNKLTFAQLEHVHQMTSKKALQYGISDDGYDYLDAAFTIAQQLLSWYYESDLDSFGKFLDPSHENFVLQIRASDGIAEEIQALFPDWE